MCDNTNELLLTLAKYGNEKAARLFFRAAFT